MEEAVRFEIGDIVVTTDRQDSWDIDSGAFAGQIELSMTWRVEEIVTEDGFTTLEALRFVDGPGDSRPDRVFYRLTAYGESAWMSEDRLREANARHATSAEKSLFRLTADAG